MVGFPHLCWFTAGQVLNSSSVRTLVTSWITKSQQHTNFSGSTPPLLHVLNTNCYRLIKIKHPTNHAAQELPLKKVKTVFYKVRPPVMFVALQPTLTVIFPINKPNRSPSYVYQLSYGSYGWGAHLANAAGEPPPMVLSRNISGRPGVKCGS